MIRTLSCDPGEQNFAISIQEHMIDPVTEVYRVRSLYSGLLKSGIQSLKDGDKLREQSRGLYLEIADLCARFGPFDDVCLERFQGRGMAVGTTSETTNIMIGAIAHLLYTLTQTPFPSLVMASTWKVECNKMIDLAECYRLCAATNHQLDAAMIGHYRACKLMDLRPFDPLRNQNSLHRMLWWIENVSEERLVKRRAQRLFHPTNPDWYAR